MKRRIQILAILMVAVMLLTACGKKVEAPELLIPVENPDAVYTAVKQKLKTTYVKEGSVCPEVVDLKFDYDSEVYDVQVQIGDFVKEGDLLFRLDEELEIKLKEAEAELTLRKKNYEVAVKQHNDQIKNMTNLRNMFGNMNDWYNYNLWDINIRENKERFNIQYDSVYQDILKFEDEYLELQEKFEHSEVTAPVDGQVVYISVADDGDMMREDVTVASIARQDKKLLACELVEEKEYQAYTDVKGFVNGKEYPIRYIPYDEEELYNKKLSAGGKLYSYFEVEGLPSDVKFGDYAIFHFTIESEEEVVSIPTQAITRVNGQPYVNVLNGDKQGMRAVTVGFSNKNYTQITAGLSEGEIVFVANNLVRYGVDYETVTPAAETYLSNGSASVQRLSMNAEQFINECPGEIKEIHISAFSQVFVREGDPLYTIIPNISQADYEEAKNRLKLAEDTYKKRVKDDKEALDKSLKNLKNMSASLEKELAKLKYDKAVKDYEKYLVDGQEYIDKCRERVEAFDEWAQGDYTVCAKKTGFLSSFSRHKVGDEVKADEVMCEFYEEGSLLYAGIDEQRRVRYGMDVVLEYRINGEVFSKSGKVITAYDVIPEDASAANLFAITLDDADYYDADSNGHILFEYAKADDAMTIPASLVKRDLSKEGGEVKEEEEDDGKFTVIGDKLTDDEKAKGVPYVWVYDANGQVVKRYITVVQYGRERVWVCDGLSDDDKLVIH
ncbi:MAG: efflux RND transporter periplasmic adaptor subunit [Lachnospiraceae bacterium]|nr:efflux RND transporter periplasmic adaptor subunit [Lachnospiraceae bacterium]